MHARDYAYPPIRPSSKSPKPSGPDRLSRCRRLRMQDLTDLYDDLNIDPKQKLPHCSTVYELEDRSKPSVSSF